MPTDDVKRARELLAAADPGPWEVCPMDMYVLRANGDMVADSGEYDAEMPRDGVARIRGAGRDAPQAANLRLIAAAPTLLARLCDALDAATARAEAAERERDELRRKIDHGCVDAECGACDRTGGGEG